MKRWLHILLVTGVLCVALATALVAFHRTAHSPGNSESSDVVESVTPHETLSTSMLFVGETFWGRGIERYAQMMPTKYATPFQGITPEVKARYQNWIGDVECPITTTDIPYQVQVDTLRLNCRPEYLSEASKVFDVFTLANNHIYDNVGVDGYNETKRHLEENLIQYFGDYDVSQTDHICEVIRIKATLDIAHKQAYMPVALCGYMLVVDDQPSAESLAVMKQYSQIMPVIAMPHMGVEYRPTGEDEKVTAYHAMIDAGADVVIGAHPHVIQNSENYKGRLIVYSTGNFLYDQQILGRDNTLGLGVGIALRVDDQQAIDAYTTIGATCADYHDQCANNLASSLKKRPVLSVSFTAECFMEPNYYPKPADEATCNDIKAQSTWDEATQKLNSFW